MDDSKQAVGRLRISLCSSRKGLSGGIVVTGLNLPPLVLRSSPGLLNSTTFPASTAIFGDWSIRDRRKIDTNVAYSFISTHDGLVLPADDYE